VKRVPDRDQVKVARRCGKLRGVTDEEPELGCGARGIGFAAGNVDHVGLLVDGPDLGETPGQREANLAGSTGQIEQPAGTVGSGASCDVSHKVRGVGQPELVVGASRSPVEIGTKRRIDH
jgi:hypothetical protein